MSLKIKIMRSLKASLQNETGFDFASYLFMKVQKKIFRIRFQFFLFFTVVLMNPRLGFAEESESGNNAIMEKFKQNIQNFNYELTHFPSIPCDKNGKLYIPDEQAKLLAKDSQAIVLSAAPLGMARYALMDGSKVVRLFTSLDKVSEFFSKSSFTKGIYKIVGLTSEKIYNFWDPVMQNWRYRMPTDKFISDAEKVAGKEADPLIRPENFKNVLIDFEKRLPRTPLRSPPEGSPRFSPEGSP
ncbi:MAG: hypothetical protein ACXWRA_06805 [Pseudobdellovibrionaceae bacterium]